MCSSHNRRKLEAHLVKHSLQQTHKVGLCSFHYHRKVEAHLVKHSLHQRHTVVLSSSHYRRKLLAHLFKHILQQRYKSGLFPGHKQFVYVTEQQVLGAPQVPIETILNGGELGHVEQVHVVQVKVPGVHFCQAFTLQYL